MKGKKLIALIFALVLAVAALGCGLYAKQQHDAAVEAAAQAAQAQAEAEAARKAAEEAAREAAAQKAAADAAAAKKAAQEQAEAEAKAKASDTKENIRYGDVIGTVWVEGTEVNCDLYWGDTSSIFHAGAGISADNGCVLPGENGTCFVGGHTDTYFVDLKSAELGAIIHLDTIYGNFEYKITDSKVIYDTDIEACNWGATEPTCILYTCYPFGIQTPTNQRYLVYADPVKTDENGVVPSTLPGLEEPEAEPGTETSSAAN